MLFIWFHFQNADSVIQIQFAGADPKTSEFAFFKKLKETSGQATNTHLQGKSQSKKLKSDDCFKGK